MKPVTIAPLAKDPTPLFLSFTAEELAALRDLASKHRTSPAAFAQLAVRQLLAHARSGATPLIAPFDLAGVPECISIEVTSWT